MYYDIDGYDTANDDYFDVNRIKDVNNYHWVLHHIAILKMQYINLKNEQLQNVKDNDNRGSFADDVLANNGYFDGNCHHQLNFGKTVADYFRYTQHGRMYLKRHQN